MGLGTTRRLVVGLLITASSGLVGATTASADVFAPAPGSPFATSAPKAVALADFDGDGKLDAAVTNADVNGVSVLAGDGRGRLLAVAGSPFVTGATGSGALATGDFNADGKADVAVTNYDTSTVSVLLGSGLGVLGPATGSPFRTNASRPVAITVADFNSDGKPDIATANQSSGDVSVLLGAGKGSLARSLGSPFSTKSSRPSSITIGDFNGDGKPDIATGNQDGNVSVLLGDGKGKLTLAAGSSFAFTPAAVGAADFNGDGKADVAVASTTGVVSVLLGDGMGKLSPGPGSPFAAGGTTPAALAVGDLNADGKADVAVANRGSANVSVLFGDGAGALRAAPQSPYATGGTAPGALAVGDVDSDGQNDLVAANATSGNVSVLLNGAASPGALVSFPAAPVAGDQVTFVYSPREATQAIEWDLNGDGVYDDALGTEARIIFPVPGTYTIGLRVTDIDGVVSTLTKTVTVSALPALSPPQGPTIASFPGINLMSPFPIVRVTGKVNRRGAWIRRFTILAPYGATINVQCQGKGCPFRKTTLANPRGKRSRGATGTVEVRKLRHRFLRAGVKLRVFVSRSGQIGKYTLLEIERRVPPVRRDLCLPPGSGKPVQCPET